jgi:hypothetical protein
MMDETNPPVVSVTVATMSPPPFPARSMGQPYRGTEDTMELQMITQPVCATCGAMAVTDHRDKQAHVNGKRRETREFACGARLEYSPNFGCVRDEKVCPKNPAMMEQERHRRALRIGIGELIDRSEADDEYKRTLRMYLGV